MKFDVKRLYERLKRFVIKQGYQHEITWRESLKFPCTLDEFFREYVWCVLNAGLSQKATRNIYDRFMKHLDLDEIKHQGKQIAILICMRDKEKWFKELCSKTTMSQQLQYLKSLPWIGEITKYHLAENIGIDIVKPDRHLERLAEGLKFSSPLELCLKIQEGTKERLGVIDIVLWRACNLVGSERILQKFYQ